MSKTFYITTPIYYVNAAAHIGHAYTSIAADVLTRFHKQRGFATYFLTGTDEHGQKIFKAAEKEGISPLAFTDKVSQNYKVLWKTLHISYDDFIRTTEKRHTQTVQQVLDTLYKSGDIYQDTYSGWYCVPCESFWAEEQLVEKKCPDCQRSVDHIAETNYFFRLSKYQAWLIDYVKSHPDFVRPQSRYNEVLSFLQANTLTDLCISRPKERLAWGIPIPFADGYVTYVWFDALINYISAIGFSYDEKKFKAWWPASIHLVGKDIIRQHAIYWPIMLHSLGLEPPKMVFAHGWWLAGAHNDSEKMSKSKGNIKDPIAIVNEFGVDVLRYFLLREVPFGLDGVFQEEAITKRFNADLANDLGNLVYRTLTMVEKHNDGKIPPCDFAKLLKGNTLLQAVEGLSKKVDAAMAAVDFSAALVEIWQLISLANKYVEDKKPWQLKKENKTEELHEFLLVMVEVLKKVSGELAPFMPETAAKIDGQIKKDRIEKAPPLFPRKEQ